MNILKVDEGVAYVSCETMSDELKLEAFISAADKISIEELEHFFAEHKNK